MENEIWKALRLYFLGGTKLKNQCGDCDEILGGREESVAERIYGSSILATALKYGYDIDVDMEKVLTMLYLHKFGEVKLEGENLDEKTTREKVLGDINGKEQLLKIMEEYDERKSRESRFVHFCTDLEKEIRWNIYIDEQRYKKDPDSIYEQKARITNSAGFKRRLNTILYYVENTEIVSPRDGNDLYDETSAILWYYLVATRLKYKIRSGWDKEHWGVTAKRVESVSEHVYSSCVLTISTKNSCNIDVDMEKVLTIMTNHEIGEALIGDITPYDHMTAEEKEEREHRAWRDVLGNIKGKDKLYSWLLEFDAHGKKNSTEEANFCFHTDKSDADYQSKVYQDKGEQRSLDDQEGNITMTFPIIKKVIRDGAKTAFDVWYETDKHRYVGSPIFEPALELVRTRDTNIKNFN